MQFPAFANKIRNWCDFFIKDEIGQRIGDPERAAIGRAEQLAVIKANIGTVTIGNIFVGFLAVLVFVGTPQFSTAIYWYLGMVLFTALTTGFRRGKIRDEIKGNRASAYPGNDNFQLFVSAIFALIWVTLPLLVFGDTNMGQQIFIVAIMFTLIGVSALFLSAIPRAATTFTIITSVGLLAAMIMNWHANMLNTVFLIVTYSLLVVGMTKRNAAFLIDRIEAKIELVESNNMIEVLLREHEDSGYEWIWEIDADGKIRNVSSKFAQAAGVKEGVLEGKLFVSLLDGGENDIARKNNSETARIIHNAFCSKVPIRDLIVGYLHPSGETRWWKLSGRPIAGRDTKFIKFDTGYRGVALDITDAKNAEEKIAYLALYDSLTNLPNRASFQEQIDKSISQSMNSGLGLSLFVLDLDKFKYVNDTLGHPAGDELLMMVAKRLSKQCADAVIVARVGGDEFSVIVDGISTVKQANEYASVLISCFKDAFIIAGRNMKINCSIGVALAPEHGNTSDNLIKNADLALYRAKTDNNCSCNIFEADMDLLVRERRLIGQELQSAIVNSELYLVYQPLLCTKTNKIIGYEALVRWNNPRFGKVNPEHFIPIAEELGIIVEIGKWVIRQACMEAAGWKNTRRVAVNMSPLQFVGIQLELFVAKALGDSGLQPSCLELEITENSLMVNKEETLTTLQNLRELGISIALDDFGTGYSSLSYLMSYPFDKIKIDRSFLSTTDSLGNNAALIRTIIGLAKNLNMRTTVEGVETVEQMEFLIQEGCDELQGYLISYPLLPSQIADENDDIYCFENISDERKLG